MDPTWQISAPAADQRNNSVKTDLEIGPAADMVWRLPAQVRLDRRTWDNETVLFNHASGQTHLLDALSARVLAAFEEKPWRLAELAAALAEELVVDKQELRERLNTIADEFARLGLLDTDIA